MNYMDFVVAYKTFLKDLPWPVCIEDTDGSILYVNTTFEELFHIISSDIEGKSIERVLNFESIVNCDSKIKGDDLSIVKARIKDKVYKIYAVPLKDEDNKVYSVCRIIVDITERIDREVKLKKQTSILRTIIDALPESIFYKDKESKFIGYNKTFQEYYNAMGVSEILGKTDVEIYNDKDIAEDFIKLDQEIMKTKKIKYYEQHVKDNLGDDIIEECVKIPVIDDEGEAWGVVGLARNITERKAIERRLRYLSEVDILTRLYNRYSFEEKVKELNKEEYLPLGIIMGDVNGLKIVNDTFGHLEGDKLLINTADVLKEICNPNKYIFRWGGDEFMILLPNYDEEKCEEIINRINEKCKEVKHDFIQINIALGEAVKKTVNEDIYECIKKVEEKVYRKKLLENKSVKNSIINSLKKSLEEKSLETNEHTKRVTTYAAGIGKRLNLKIAELDELMITAQLHDIGKIGIDEYLLKKPTTLTEEEYEIMKTHAEKGYRIINASSDLDNVAKCVLSHHERWDGEGYPFGLKGEEIPLISRIISVADTYDVITNDRPYRKALNHKMAIDELERCSGTQFDPIVVKEFKKFMESRIN